MATPETPQTIEMADLPSRRGCLSAGCQCKDARIVSHRRAAFFAVVARRAGDTADRMIPVERGWQIPLASETDLVLLVANEAAPEFRVLADQPG
jgi:hypothetical protein